MLDTLLSNQNRLDISELPRIYLYDVNILLNFRAVYEDMGSTVNGNLTEGIIIEKDKGLCPNTTCRVHTGKC